jgi:uncharacterized repeat protein (TIGR01451 family)
MSYPIMLPPEGALLAPVPEQGTVNPTGQAPQNQGTGGTNQSQSAKKKPGSLRVQATLQMKGNNVLRVGERVVFAIDIDNTGELDIATTTLSAVLPANLKPIAVTRREGTDFNDLRLSADPQAKIEGQQVVFNRIENLTPTQKWEYQITAEVLAGATSGKLEVTATSSALGSEPLRKEVPFTVQ